MNPGKDNLLHAARCGGPDIQQYILPWATPTRTTQEGGDTKCAAVITAILNLDKKARSEPGARQGGTFQELLIKSIFRKLQHLRYQLIFA